MFWTSQSFVSSVSLLNHSLNSMARVCQVRLSHVIGVRYRHRMTKPLSDAEFSAAEGVEDWRVLYWGAKALFKTGDFATGAKFVAAIAEHAAALSHDPLVD